MGIRRTSCASGRSGGCEMDIAHAKLVCEASFLGVAVDGLKANVNPNVQGVGIGHKVVHRIATKERALQVYVNRKMHPRLLAAEDRIPDEIEGGPPDVGGGGTGEMGGG